MDSHMDGSVKPAIMQEDTYPKNHKQYLICKIVERFQVNMLGTMTSEK